MGRGSRVVGRGCIAVTALLFVACGSTAHAPAATAPVPTPSPTPVLLSSDVGVTIENVVLACREKDAPRLSALLATPPPESEIEALFALGRDVVLKGQTPSVTGDEASVAVELEVQRAAGSERVRRTWLMVRGADGFWRLTALPDCY